jgi:protein TonB
MMWNYWTAAGWQATVAVIRLPRWLSSIGRRWVVIFSAIIFIVFTVINDHPVPKDGMGAYYKYISENMKYPAQARKMGIEGKVFVQFVVDAKGKLIDVKAVKGIGAGCDEEAVKVVKESPLWNPGLVGDKAGKVIMILPISFKLN